MDHQHEFRGETPATTDQKILKTGERVDEDGAYACATCGEWRKAPMVNLTKGQMIPVCSKCGPDSRWVKV